MIGTVLAVAAAQAGTGQIRTRLAVLGDQRPARCSRAGVAGRGLPRRDRRRVLRHALAGGDDGDRDPRSSRSSRSSPARSGCSTCWARWTGATAAPARLQRSGRRLAIGVTAAIAFVSAGDAVRRPRLRPRPAGAERRPRRHGRGRLQRPRRALRPAPRRGRPGRHPQLDGGELAGRVPLRSPAGRHRRPAGERRAGVPHRPPLRRPRSRTSSAPTSAASPRRSWRRPSCRRTSAPRPRASSPCSAACRRTPNGRSTCATSTASSAPRRRSTRSASSTTSCARTPTRSSCSCSRTSSTPTDAVAVLERSGLAGHALSWRPGEPLPTLGEMISRDDNVRRPRRERRRRRAVVHPRLRHAPGHAVHVRRARASSRATSGGAPRTNPLFMVNHWITVDPPSRAVAAEANARDVLLDAGRGVRDRARPPAQHPRRRLLRRRRPVRRRRRAQRRRPALNPLGRPVLQNRPHRADREGQDEVSGRRCRRS